MKCLSMIALVMCATLGFVSACGDDAAALSDSSDDVIQRWSKAGLQATAFKALDKHTLGKGKCRRGSVGGIETTVCSYASAADATAARAAGLTMVGERTGAALAHGNLLLVVADRARKDPSGRAMNRITRLFRDRASDGD